MFDAADTLETTLAALAGCVDTLAFDIGAMRSAASDPSLFATDLAEALVASGVAFRDAHRRVGELFARLETEGRALDAPDTPGGPAPDRVREQLGSLAVRLEAHRA